MKHRKTILSFLRWKSILILIFIFNNNISHAQIRPARQMRNTNKIQNPFAEPDSVMEYQQDTAQFRSRSICKSFDRGNIYYMVPRPVIPVPKINEAEIQKEKVPFLTAHGTVQYSFLYRSYIDTPFAQPDFQEHAIRANVNLMFKNRYPLNLNISTRFNNSMYFKDFFDVNLLYDKNVHLNKIKQRLYEKVNQSYPGLALSQLEQRIKEELDKYKKYKVTIQEPGELQRAVEAREKLFIEYQKRLNKPSSLNDSMRFDASYPKLSIDSLLGGKGKNTDKYLDSLDGRIKSMMQRADSLRYLAESLRAIRKEKIYKASDLTELKDISAEMGEKDSVRNKLEKTLMSFEKIGIGRTILDYSELTASNVLLTGINLEYNDGVYAAVAAGKIDYGFRDFFGIGTSQRKQQLIIGRIGLANRKKAGIIFSAFTGRKNNSVSITNDSISDQINVTGYSLETFVRKGEFTSLTAEIAKTTRPVTGSMIQNGEFKNLFDYTDNSNLGISLKAQTAFKRTNTRLSGFYRKLGSKFQAFNLYANNSDQDSWNVKVDQSLLRNHISLTGMLRKNDFSNPYTEKDFKTTSILGSIQTSIRFPRLPVLSAGYFPGTQIYIIDNKRLKESAYYILNGSLTHNYTLADIRMVSSLMYNMYASKGTDSGFIAYQGKMAMASHSLLFTRFQWQSAYTYTQQEIMNFYTLESGVDYSVSSHFRIGGKGKYNRVIEGDYYLGQSAYVTFEIKKIGTLQFYYDKSYLPTTQKSLFPIQSGRALWYKNF